MNDYTKGILTGASLILCFFMFVSAKSEEKGSFDTVWAKNIFVGEAGKGITSIGPEGITTLDSLARVTAFLGTSFGTGTVKVYSSSSSDVVAIALGNNDFGGGALLTWSADFKMTTSLGTAEGDVGYLRTYDSDGKETVFLGTGEGGGGNLTTYNKHEVQTGYFGTNKESDGNAILLDRYGDVGWAETGKK